jgi:ubiquinone/menaquinone biosynthesis C-methylase UbiE
MKLNWAERWVVNNPLRVFEQRVEIRWLRKMTPLKRGAKILEVGCGRGAGAKQILKTFQPSVLHVLDLDLQMVQKAKDYLCEVEKGKVYLYVGDVLHLPFKERSLDAVFGFGVLHHIQDWQGSLAEIARVLKIGGAYFIEELYPALYQNFITKRILLHPHEDRFQSKDLMQGLKEMNMSIKAAVEFRKLGILGLAIRKT